MKVHIYKESHVERKLRDSCEQLGRERKRATSTFGVNHPVHPDGRAHSHIGHVLRRDEDILLLVRVVGCVDHHLHTDATIDRVHEDIELVCKLKSCVST